MTKETLAEREQRIVYLRDKQHLKNGGEQLLWKEIGQRFGLEGERVAFIYRRVKKKLEDTNVKR